MRRAMQTSICPDRGTIKTTNRHIAVVWSGLVRWSNESRKDDGKATRQFWGSLLRGDRIGLSFRKWMVLGIADFGLQASSIG